MVTKSKHITDKARVTIPSLFVTVFVVTNSWIDFVVVAEQEIVCLPGDTQTCICPDNEMKSQACLPDSTGWKECDCIWFDEWCERNSGLCWQDPPKENDGQGVTSYDAMRYCDELTASGYDDWRLPTLEEMRSIVRGNKQTGSGILSICPISDGSEFHSLRMIDIVLCYGKFRSFTCHGSGGCCWESDLRGTCDTVDPASSTHYLEYWTSTPAADDPDWVGFVFFDTGTVGFNHALSLGEVRCVRDNDERTSQMTFPSKCDNPMESCIPGETKSCVCDNVDTSSSKAGAQRCIFSDDTDASACYGTCQCSDFIPSPPPIDVCPQCDTITVTVNVPRKLEKQPYMLAVFLYNYGEIDFRPPDVGVEENEIRYPDIDVDKPLTTVIPGCSYYRDRCMSGEYFLSVYLKMDEGRFPAVPNLFGDMAWRGNTMDPITLAGDGTMQYEFEVTLETIIRSVF